MIVSGPEPIKVISGCYIAPNGLVLWAISIINIIVIAVWMFLSLRSSRIQNKINDIQAEINSHLINKVFGLKKKKKSKR